MKPVGFVNFLKPPGMTSHDVVSSLRRLFGEKCIGHLGTLDPGAAGVLPVAVGSQATKIIEYVSSVSKGYRAEMLLGRTSNTGDLFGDVIVSGEHAVPDAERILAILASFEGTIEQTPPMASSIKVNGKKLYEYFRKGANVEIPQRTVVISSVSLVEYTYPKLVIDVECSCGTYIRTLCSDIGAAAGCGALMSFLVRYRSGNFCLEQSLSYEEISVRFPEDISFFISPYDVMETYGTIILTEPLVEKVRHGNQFCLQSGEPYPPENTILRLADEQGNLLAVGKAFYDGGIYIKPEKVFISGS